MRTKATWLSVILALLIVPQVHSMGGVSVNNAKPLFDRGSSEDTFEDMRVKVLGGYVRINRSWSGKEWVWNRRWSDLTNAGGKSIYQINYENAHRPPPPPSGGSGSDSGGSSSGRIGSFFRFLFRDNQAYRMPSNVTASEGGFPEGTYESQIRYTIEVGSSDFVWRDRRGNAVYYDNDGRMTHYHDRNGVTVSVTRYDHGGIETVRDHHNNVVITYTWELIPGTEALEDPYGNPAPEYRLVKLTDYTGREVIYYYDDLNNGVMYKVTDVRGFDWTYQYSGQQLSAQIDPDGRKTRYLFEARNQGEKTAGEASVLKERYNADGVGFSYAAVYYSNSDRYHLSEKDGENHLTLTTYYSHGVAESQLIEGERQFTTAVSLSNNISGTTELVKRYESSNRQGLPDETGPGSGVGGTVITGSVSGSGIDRFQSQPVYIKEYRYTDARGNETKHEYDQWHNVVKITRPDGTTVTSTYNTTYSLPLIVTDEKGVVTEHQYDEKGNLSVLIEAKGTPDQRITRFSYDAYGQLETVTTGESTVNNTALATTTYHYDNYGNLIEAIDPLNDTVTFSNHDVLGNARTITDARNHHWTRTFDAAGNLLTDTNPLNQGEIYTYTPAGEIKTITEANGSVTTVTTNASGLPTTFTDANHQITRLEYDKVNRLTAIIDANGHGRYRQYDPQGRIKKLIDGEGNQTTFDYLYTLLDTIHYPTYDEVLHYDNRNRLDSSMQKANSLEYLRRYGYDLADNLEKSTDANQNVEEYRYDDLHRLVKVIDADGGETEFTYDARDNLLRVKDPEGRLTVYTYTLRDELETETKHNFVGTGKQRVYEYDENGNLTAVINPQQEKTKNTYDAANRLTKSEVFAHKDNEQPIKVVIYNYDTKNQYTGYSQTPGADTANATADIFALSETYTYNNLGQLETVTVDFGAFQKSYSYTYYPNGLKKTYTNPESITYTYYYNKNNQIRAVHIPGEGQLAWTDFQWLMPQALVFPGGNKITLAYDDFMRVKQRLLRDQAGNGLGSAVYDYDLESNVDKMTTEHGIYDFGYDDLYRLILADYPAASTGQDESFSYDGVGNRRTRTTEIASETPVVETSGYNNHNQLTGIDTGITFAYNDNGHTVRKTEGGQVTDYLYNREERLTEVKVDGTAVGQYAYNPYGQRVRKIAGGQTTWFLYNDEGLAAEYDSGGALIKEYHFKPYSPWMTEPLFQRGSDGVLYYYQNDHLGTPQRMLAKSGAVVWEARYEAFGRAAVVANAVENNLRFPGQYFDGETGLHHNYFRDYDPSIGRYVQSDPIGLDDGPNTYAYVYNSPLNYTDPTGEFGLFGAGFGAALDLGLQLLQNGGNFKCVDWGQVVVAAGLGAIGGGLTHGLFNGAFRFRVARSIGGKPPSYTWGATKHWGRDNNIRALQVSGNQQRHHWLLQQNQGWGRNAPEWLKNQPWNINPVSAPFNNWMSKGATNWRSLLGAPPWAQGLVGGSAVAGGGAAANSLGGNGCECS